MVLKYLKVTSNKIVVFVTENFSCGTDADKSNFYSIFAPMKTGQVIRQMISEVKARLARLPYRTGIVVTALCLPCYIISFAQMALPISTALKGGGGAMVCFLRIGQDVPVWRPCHTGCQRAERGFQKRKGREG